MNFHPNFVPNNMINRIVDILLTCIEKKVFKNIINKRRLIKNVFIKLVFERIDLLCKVVDLETTLQMDDGYCTLCTQIKGPTSLERNKLMGNTIKTVLKTVINDG